MFCCLLQLSKEPLFSKHCRKLAVSGFDCLSEAFLLGGQALLSPCDLQCSRPIQLFAILVWHPMPFHPGSMESSDYIILSSKGVYCAKTISGICDTMAGFKERAH